MAYPTLPQDEEMKDVEWIDLPTKMIIEPRAQDPQESIEEYLTYWDSVCSANIWDDTVSALYLPQFITDQRYCQLIRNLKTDQRRSYRWLRMILLEMARQQQHQQQQQRPPRSLCNKYWKKIGELRQHIRGDLCQITQEIHGLVGETYQHVAENYVDPQKLIKNVVPPVVEQTVSRAFERFTSMAGMERNPSAPSTTPPPPHPPSYQDIYGSKMQ